MRPSCAGAGAGGFSLVRDFLFKDARLRLLLGFKGQLLQNRASTSI